MCLTRRSQGLMGRVPGGACNRRVLIRGFVRVAVRMNPEFVLTGSDHERRSCTPSLLTLIDCSFVSSL